MVKSPIPFFLNSVLAIIHICATEYYQQPFLYLWLCFSLLPMLDQFIPEDHSNPTPEEEKILEKEAK